MNIDEIYKIINDINALTYQGRSSKAKHSISRICSKTIERLNSEGLA